MEKKKQKEQFGKTFGNDFNDFDDDDSDEGVGRNDDEEVVYVYEYVDEG